MRVPLIAIVGFMASGKTTVAEALGCALGWAVGDLDEVITRSEGRSPREIIDEDGEPAFRSVETRVLGRFLRQTDDARVVALGGGTWERAENRDLLAKQGATIVWLDTPFATCWERIRAAGDERPLGRERRLAEELFARRRATYRLATFTITAAAGLTPEVIASEIVGRLGSPNAEPAPVKPDS
jgi:shikimate kinase